MSNVTRVVVGTAATIALITGCTSTTPIETPTDMPPEFLAVWELAHNNGASDTQLGILAAAGQAGEVTYSDVSLALEATFECFENNGVYYMRVPDIITAEGLPRPAYGWGGSATPELSDEMSRIGAKCLFLNSYYVELMYQVQPDAIEYAERNFEENRQAILDCLHAQGVLVDDSASRDEIYQAITEAAGFLDPDLDPSVVSDPVINDGPIACLAIGQ